MLAQDGRENISSRRCDDHPDDSPPQQLVALKELALAENDAGGGQHEEHTPARDRQDLLERSIPAFSEPTPRCQVFLKKYWRTLAFTVAAATTVAVTVLLLLWALRAPRIRLLPLGDSITAGVGDAGEPCTAPLPTGSS